MPLGTVPEDVSPEAIAFAKQSFKLEEVEKMRHSDAEFGQLYEVVKKGIVSNVKTQPGGFKATSGVVLPYYLNLSTNFMDPHVAPRLVKLFARSLLKFRELLGVAPDERVSVVGMEVAGGMLVSQLVAIDDPELNRCFDFVYMRKNKKTTGTAQQLEGMKMFTSRTATSPKMKTIWIDDVNSTGSSLCEGITTLLNEYNMDVIGALYVVDRSVDRANLENPRQRLSDQRFTSKATVLGALMDLNEIDPLVVRE